MATPAIETATEVVPVHKAIVKAVPSIETATEVIPMPEAVPWSRTMSASRRELEATPVSVSLVTLGFEMLF